MTGQPKSTIFLSPHTRIWVVFVWLRWDLFTILESGNITLNTLAPWPAVVKGRLYSIKKPEEINSTFTTFSSKFSVAELAPKLVNSLCSCAVLTYSLSLQCSCVYWYNFLLHVQQWNRFYTHTPTSLHSQVPSKVLSQATPSPF